MTYPDSIEKKIGFDAVREHLKALCSSTLGHSGCDEMAFSADVAEVRRRLAESDEMLHILASDDEFPLGGIHDLRRLVAEIRVPGTHIGEQELPAFRSCIATMGEVATFFQRLRDDEGHTPYPALDYLAEGLSAFPEITSAIDRVIDRHGEIKDSASPALAEIRRELNAMSGTVNAAMRRVMSAAAREGYLEADATPSVREGRLVIPVAPMYKRKIQGIVHDESASGKTIYIEPAEVVEANNRLRELRIEERREIIRILTALTDSFRPRLDEIAYGFRILGTFDFIRAKARFAKMTDSHMPHLSDSPELELYHACHPILAMALERQGKKIVPLDLTLGPERRILVISGPNAGGKSVTLKTVAIVQYMLQCGLLPPVYENSHIGLMDNIFLDIGDDQSIEDDLSTYSSHLRNMKFFVTRGNSRTLILIDEFGGGTEPQIGGAIAQALLKQFNTKGMWGIVTTHYHNLKQYAEETSGLVNGSMLYDRNLMQPTFRLAIGHPGSSFAIEIARKTGLPDEIIADAKEIAGSDYTNLDKYLLDIARDRRYWENKRTAIHQKEKKMQELLDRYEADADTLRAKRKEIIAEAREEARKILEGSNAAIERTIRDIRQAQAEREKTREARRKLQEERRALNEEADASKDPHPLLDKKRRGGPRRPDNSAENKTTAEKKVLEAGDNVLLDGAGTVGTIESMSGKNATVVFGQIKTTVKLERLTPTIRKATAPKAQPTSFVSAGTLAGTRERQLNFKQEIDVRGMRVDEAVQAVMYFIDDAVQFNAGRVRILHGTGTGALRQYIRDYLDSVGAVRRYHDEDVRFGGAGITVVEFE